MAPFSFTHDTPMITRTQVKRQKLLPRMNIPAIINAVGESISKFVADLATVSGTAAALEDLSVNIRSDALSRWITRLSRLESMTLWDGAILDGYFGKIIKTHCHNFNSLNIYTCVGDQVDLNLAGFLTAMSNNTLKSLRIFSRNDVGENTFQALNHHHESLVDLVLGNIKPSALKALSSLQGLTALRSLDLNDIGNLINLETTENERFLDILNWVTSCRQLKTIRLQDFMDGPAIMKALCLKDEIHLKALTLSGLGYNLVNNQEFHLSLAHQTSLESLELRADAEECVRDDIDTLVSSLCLLRELRYLNILDTSEYFQSLQIQQLALSLPKVSRSPLNNVYWLCLSICIFVVNIHRLQLEDLSVSGYGMGDEVWPAISQLHHLKSLSFHSMTSFSFEGILNYISNLQPGNSGLLLSIMNAAIESLLNASEQAFIRDAIAEKVDGRFEFVLYRELESEFDSDSD